MKCTRSGKRKVCTKRKGRYGLGNKIPHKQSPVTTEWILTTGTWDDSGLWIDTASWID